MACVRACVVQSTKWCARGHVLTISYTYTQSHTQLLEGLRCRASSKAQCCQCAQCAAFNHQRCATGLSGLPNSPLQHWGKWSWSLLNGEGGTGREKGGGEERGRGACEREIKNEGKVNYSLQWKTAEEGKKRRSRWGRGRLDGLLWPPRRVCKGSSQHKLALGETVLLYFLYLLIFILEKCHIS